VARALPGLVVGLAFVYFSVRYARPLYQTSAMVVLAYTVMFLPLAVVAVQAALIQSPPRLEEVGRSLGRGPMAVFCRVTLPLIAPGLAAALALVFLSSVHELTATLLLRPTGAETLTTQFWVYTSGVAYGAGAPYAALLVLLSAGPAYVLVRRLDALAAVGAR
jgi:iron(III) transport system permease protein